MNNARLMMSEWGRKLAKNLARGERKWKPDYVCNKWNIVRGDVVEVIHGPHSGQQGKIQAVIRRKNRVIVEGVNMRPRNFRANSITGEPGRRVIAACSIHYSNVMLVDPTTGKPTKVNRKFMEDGTKVRVSKASGQIIPKPPESIRVAPRSSVIGVKDTPPADVFKVTFENYAKYLPFIYKTLNKK